MKNDIRYSREELWTKQKDIAEKLGLHKRSITPDTLKEIIFEKSEQDLLYNEHYKHKNSEVIRFGLNVSSPELLNIVKKYNDDKKEVLETKSLTSVASEKNASKNIDTISNHQKNSTNILTKLEYINTNTAIEHLKTGAKTVLVDIFDRWADSNIKINNEGIPETHTVVLYEKSGKYLVIDPSNTTFSYVLGGTNENIRLCFSNKLQIYKASGKVGTKSDEWRECIDVAVKLAFNLTVNSKLGFDNLIVKELGQNIGYIDFESIKENPAIREITNQKSTIYNNLHDVVKDCSIRVKQSSDVLNSKKATALLTTLESVFSKLSNIFKEKGFIHSLKVFNEQEETLVKNIFLEQDYKKCLESSINAFKMLDTPFYNIVKDEVELLAAEFYYIDKI